MDRFEQCAAFLLRLEGFESDDPDDRGGATRLGVSLRLLRQLPDGDADGYLDGDLDQDGDVDAADVRRVTLGRALEIYRSEFWLPCRCPDLPIGLDMALFGAAVNHGVGLAVRLFQHGLGVKADGAVGPVTLAHARAAGRDGLLVDFLARRARLYHDIVISDSSQAKWLDGWLRRLFRVHAWILTGVDPA